MRNATYTTLTQSFHLSIDKVEKPYHLNQQSTYKMQDPSSQATTMKNPRVVRTYHDSAASTSTFCDDQDLTPFNPFGPQGSGFSIVDLRPSIPVNNTEFMPPLSNTLPRCPQEGVIFCITDIPPQGCSPLHRTLSLDYAVVVSGEVVLRLDSGNERVVRAGDFIVQQGADHQWINKTQNVCRIAFVMIGAASAEEGNGEKREDTAFKS